MKKSIPLLRKTQHNQSLGDLTIKKGNTVIGISLSLVPKVGLEPTRYHYQRILSPSRLPFHHFGVSIIESFIIIINYYKKIKRLNAFFEKN